LVLYARADNDPELQAMLWQRSANDPHFFFDQFAWADNYGPDRVRQVVPFVPFGFQRPGIDAILGRTPAGRDALGRLRSIAIDKSRELGITFLVLWCAIYDFLFSDAGWGVMTYRGPDLDGPGTKSLFGKLKFMLRSLPAWMRPPITTRSRPALTLLNKATGAEIHGSPTIEDAFSGGRLKRIFIDEGAKVPKLRGILAATQDVAPLVVISSAKGYNDFARLIHGELFPITDWPEQAPGWTHLRFHYSSHPHRQPGTPQGDAWREAVKAERTKEAWAQEQEIDYRASVPGKIWPEFDRNFDVLDEEQWAMVERLLPSMTIFEGWDFGSGASLTGPVWAGYLPSNDTLYVIDYRVFREATYKEVAAEVGRAGWYTATNRNGRRPHHRTGDIAGTARDSSQRSWISNLRREGIDIRGRTLARRHEAVIDRMRVRFGQQKILFSPMCAKRHNPELPSLVECVEQHRRNQKGSADEHVGDTPPPLKDIFSHLADGLKHVFDEAYPTETGRVITPGEK